MTDWTIVQSDGAGLTKWPDSKKSHGWFDILLVGSLQWEWHSDVCLTMDYSAFLSIARIKAHMTCS